MSRTSSLLALVGAAASAGLVLAPPAAAAGPVGAVYALSNAPSGNAVHVFTRGPDGTLAAAGTWATTGTGTGGGLGSQGAVVLDAAERHLYAVDPGSDSVTSFRVVGAGLQRIGTVPSGGDLPTSVTAHGDRLYVLNAGSDSISGFAVGDGALTPLPGSTRPLSGTGTMPAQVAFTPDGDRLLVTERATALLQVFELDDDGLPASATAVASAGAVPFGFDFDNKGNALVSEAGPSAASSYAPTADGLRTVSASVGTTENAACWLVVTGNGRFAYTGNAGGSLSISGFAVRPDASLSLLTPDGRTGTTSAGVTDLALSRNSQFLYGRLGDGTVAAFAVGRDGGLTPLGGAGGLPAGAAGLAAR